MLYQQPKRCCESSPHPCERVEGCFSPTAQPLCWKKVPLHVLVSSFHGFSSKAHVLEHLCVCVGILQRLPLELNGGQRAVDLRQLLLVSLLAFQGLKSSCWQDRESKFQVSDTFEIFPDSNA